MKIAQIVGLLVPGGMLHAAVTLTNALSAAGHSTDIIYWDGKVPEYVKSASTRFVRVNIFGLSRHNVLSNITRKLGKLLLGHSLFPYYYAPFLTPQMTRFLSQGNYDVVAFHDRDYFGFHLLKCPHFAIVHSTQSKALLGSVPSWPKWRKRRLRRIYARIYHDKRIIAVSQGARDDLVKHFGAAPDKAKYIYNPLDFKHIQAKIKNANDEEAVSSPHPRPYILGAGRCIPLKNFSLLLRAYAEARCKEDLVIIGDGRYKSYLQRLAEQLEISNKVCFAGFQPNPYPWFLHARLFVLSSNYEGLSMVILEALACGTPVVSTDCPNGPAEILSRFDLSDYLSPVDDVETLARNIARALADPPRINMTGLDAFRPDTIAKEYLTLMQEVLHEEAGA